MKKISIILSLVCSLSINASAQDINQRELAILEKNLDLYKTGKYEKSEQNFALIINRLPNSVYLTTNYLLWGKSKYKLQDYKGSLKITQDFLALFPDSDYRDDIMALQGNCYFQLKRYETALQTWLQVIDLSTNDLLIQKLGYQVTKTIRYKFDEQTTARIYPEEKSFNAGILFRIAEAEEQLQRGKVEQANQTIQNALQEFPGSKFNRRAESFLTSGEIQAGDITFALLLPLSGNNEKIGQEIKEGFEFSLEEYNQQNNSNLRVLVKNYGEEVIEAIRAYQELAKNNNILAVLGPVENDISAICAALSDYETLPIVSPTATETELTQLTDKFFQLNPSVALQAEYLAQYATDSLHLKRYATFAPLDNHFIKMVSKFVEYIRGKGGEVVAQEWYYPGDQNVNKQFMNLKRIGLRYTFADSVLKDRPGLRQEQVDSLYKKYVESQYQEMQKNDTKIDSADIPVKSIDGIFIPIFKEDLKFIAPQIAYSNIQAQYFGNVDWYDPDELKKNKNYINGLMFITDGYLNEENWDYKKVKNEYRIKTKKTPTIYNLIGYDCSRYMIRALKDTRNPITRPEYLQNLRSHDKYEGLYRNIEIGEDQANTNLRLLKYIFGQIIPLK